MQFTALPTDLVRAFRNKAPDAYDMPPEHALSDGVGKPCRHCLSNVPAGKGMLILAHRPFDELHPYAETGPIFLCADACTQGGGTALPAILKSSPTYLLKGYCERNRIIYGSGKIVAHADIATHANALFANPKVAYVHARSASNNCYLLRIDRS